VEIAVAVEYLAHMAFLSLQLDPRLKAIEPALSAKHFLRKHGPAAYYGQASRR
jgi:L-ribulose-5-phosphate 4-epimerase